MSENNLVSALSDGQESAGDVSEYGVSHGSTTSQKPQRLLQCYGDFFPSSPSDTYAMSSMRIKTSILCSKCQRIRGKLAKYLDDMNCLDSVYSSTLEHYSTLEHSPTLDHYQDSRDLKQSALYGCHLCNLILDSFNPEGIDNFDRMWTRKVAMNDISNGTPVQLKVSRSIYVQNQPEQAHLRLRTMPGQVDSFAITGRRILLTSSPSCPPTHLSESPITLSSIHVSTATVATANLAIEWIARCTKFHSKCGKPKGSFLPTRLIDVQTLRQTGKIRVTETRSLPCPDDIRYLVLSYCWGSTPTFKLEKSTGQALSSGVGVQILPKTIQDAIYFTQSINMRWLWVDSLCIIQDSQEDWNDEALTMCQVYQNSFLSLAALAAAHSDEGLFAIRDPLLYSACSLFSTKEGKHVFAEPSSHSDPHMAWPLHQRGWVMQERILPSRTLNFGPYLIWQCQENIDEEYNIISQKDYREEFALSKRFAEIVLSDSVSEKYSKERNKEILGLWRRLAAEYTDGVLSVPTDRLIAISGIIAVIHSCTGWTNQAGLWEPFLWKELLWKKVLRKSIESRKFTGLQPSWSWIAITGAVGWADFDAKLGVSCSSVAHVQRITELLPSQADTDSSSDHPLAILVSCIAGKLRYLSPIGVNIGRHECDVDEFPLSGRGAFIFDICTDTRQPELFLPTGIEIWPEGSLFVLGLAVCPSMNCEGAFERVGLCTFQVDREKKSGDSMDHNLAILHDVSRRKDYILV